MILALVALLAACVIVGVLTLRLGLHGRKIDDHPICRRCGFDLFGLDHPPRCPECGVELSPKVIRIGHRATRRMPLTLGLILAGSSLAALVSIGIIQGRSVDWITYKPAWWLVRDGDAPALSELNRRMSVGTLSDADINRVVAAGITAQADLKHPFLVGWGKFIEQAFVDRKVDAESWKRYARQSVPLTLVARTNVRRGDVVPIGIRYGPMRLFGPGLRFRFDFGIIRATLGGVPLAGGAGVNTGARHNDKGQDMDRALHVKTDEIARLPDGPATLQVEVATKLFEETGGVKGKELWADSVTLTTTVNLVPANQSTVEIVADPAMRTAVEGSLVLHGYDSSQAIWSSINESSGRFVHISKDRVEFLIDTKGPPIGLAYDTIARDRTGREWPLHTITFSRGKAVGWIVSGQWDGFDADQVDVILRVNPAAAAETVHIDRIWNGEITFKDVDVKWDKDAKRTPTRSSR